MKDSLSANSELIKEISAQQQRIQDLEQSESALRKVSNAFSEYTRQSDNIFNAINNSVCVIDPDGRIIKCNQSTEKLLNKSIEELHGHFCFEMIHGASKPLPDCPFLRMKETKHRESMVIQSDDKWLEVTVDPILDNNRHIVAVVHIIADITERTWAELALKESEAKYRALFENAVEGIFQVTPEGRFISANPAQAKLFGYDSPQELIEQITDVGRQHYVNQKDRERYRNTLESEGAITGFETQLFKKDGSTIWVSLNAKVVRNKEDTVIYYEGTVEDITERKQAEEALRENALKFRTLFDSANDAIFIMKNYLFFDCNRKTLEIFRCDKGDIIGKSPMVFSPETQPDGQPSSEKAVEKMNMALRGAPQFFEWKHQRIDGTLFDTEVSLNGIKLDDNIYLQAIVRDITERKQAEEALRWKTALLEAQMNASIDGILVVDENQRRIVANQRIIDLWGVPRHILDDEDDAILLQYVVGLVKYPEQFLEKVMYLYDHPYEASRDEIVFKNGMVLDRYSAPVLGENGHHYGRIWTFSDITDRRKTEGELCIAHQRLFDIIDFLPDATFVIDHERKVIAWNKAIEAMTGIQKKDILGKGDYAYAVPFYGEPRPILIDAIFERVENSKNRYDFITQEESTFSAEVYVPMTYQRKGAFLSATASPFLDSEGRTIGAIESIRDVTEQKRIERELQESEERYRIAIDSSNDGIAIMKGERHLYVNQRFVEMFGYEDPDEIIGESNSKTVHPDDFKLVNDINVRRQRGEPVPARYEFKGIKKDGTPTYIEASATGTKYQGDLVSLVFLRDITSRKEAEEAITREREKLKTLSDNAPFGMALIDKESHFTYINKEFTELFGYDLSDIPDGRTWCRKAYPDAKYRHTVISAWREDLRDTRPGEQKNVFTITCKDGTLKIVRFIFSVLVSGDSLMTCEDITELRQLENQLRQAQKTEAIGTLAGGIAHDFNNILTALMGYAALIQLKMDTADPLQIYVDQVLTASEKAVDLTQSLLAFSRQQSVTLVPLNMNHIIKVAEKLLRRLLIEDIEFSTLLNR